MLLIAEDLSDGEALPFTRLKLGLFGLGLPLMHSPARWLGVAFFYSLPAAFTFTLVVALRYFCNEGLQLLGYAAAAAGRLASLVTLLFASTTWIIFQFAYYHNGNIAATFLLLGVGSIWIALVRRERAWLWIGTLALLGLSITRLETVFFALAIIGVAIAVSNFRIDDWLTVLLPFTIVALAWYGWLLVVASPDTKLLTPLRLVAYLAIIALSYLGVLALRADAIRRIVRPRLYRLLFVGLGVAGIGLALLYPDRLFMPVWSTIVTLFLLGVAWWGLLWWLIVVVVFFLARAPAFSNQRFYTGVIATFFSLYLLLGIAARGFAIAYDGSGNRMALHILPVIFLYLALRAAPVVAPVRARDYVDLTKTVPAPIAEGDGLL
jgi:hypothetical protein